MTYVHSPKTAAVVVLYFPDWKILKTLLDSLRPQVDKLYLICNGIDEDCKVDLEREHQYTQLIELDNNPGLGKALNVGMLKALDDKVEHLFLFDQDSIPDEIFIQSMLEQLAKAQTIEDQKQLTIKNSIKKIIPSKVVGAIGPSFYDARSASNNETIHNRFKKDGKPQSADIDKHLPIECDCLITSGMLINLCKIEPTIFFDESYFIDHVDSEWCFRVRSESYSIYGSGMVSMGHRISDGRPLHVGPLTFLSYSPIRRYWNYKNSVRLIHSSNTSLRWKLRLLSIMIISFIPNAFIDRSPVKSILYMLHGVIDGIRAKNF